MDPFSLITFGKKEFQTNFQTGSRPWLQLLLLLSIQIHWFLLLMLHIRHTCFFTIVHGSPWFVSTNSKCFAAAKMCTWSTYQFSTDFRKAKYFQLQECWWFPASRFVKISIDKLLNSIREEESVFNLVSIRWTIELSMDSGIDGLRKFLRTSFPIAFTMQENYFCRMKEFITKVFDTQEIL